MNSTVDAQEFSTAMSRVMKLTAKHSSLPILEKIKVSFTGTTCTLTATDLEQWAVWELPAEGDAFSFALDHTKEILKMLHGLSEPLRITFERKETLHHVTLFCGGRESQFFVSDAEDYPVIPQIGTVQTYHADSGALLEKVDTVSYAASTDMEKRPSLSGVRFWGREVYCVDGYRMAVADNDQMEVREPFAVPVHMFRSWRALFPTGEVELAVDKQFLQVSVKGVTALFRLLEPDTLRPQKVFPTSCRERYQVQPKEFARELAYLSGFVTLPLHQPVAFRKGGCPYRHPTGRIPPESP